MKLKMLNDKIAVKLIERVKSSVLTVIMSEKPNTGVVIGVGADAAKHVTEGDLVRFGTMNRDTKEEYLSYPYITDENGDKIAIMSWKDVTFIEDNHATN